jgi:hypothetical protein
MDWATGSWAGLSKLETGHQKDNRALQGRNKQRREEEGTDKTDFVLYLRLQPSIPNPVLPPLIPFSNPNPLLVLFSNPLSS